MEYALYAANMKSLTPDEEAVFRTGFRSRVEQTIVGRRQIPDYERPGPGQYICKEFAVENNQVFMRLAAEPELTLDEIKALKALARANLIVNVYKEVEQA